MSSSQSTAQARNQTKRIQLLPEHIIDQIKAGEVIERPSTLLKELLENSVDAGATEIEIEINNNGLDLLSVKDNGKGIPFDELDLAFCRHATSKIERFEDIYSLFTYGFRGEALASIAAVSKLTCVSSQAGKPEGLIKIYGGETIALDQDKEPEARSGTSMFIRDLFYNTPARMKFIQSKTSEKNQLEKIVKAFLLTQPGIKFTVKWDDQDKRVFPARPESQLKKRVEDSIKKSRPVTLLEFTSSYDEASFKVFLSLESTRGNAGKSQFIFVNGRLVQDVQIHKIILTSAQSMWPLGESGHYCAYIDLPSERVDVNIHPNKTQVKFFEASKIFSLVSASIKDGLSKQRERLPEAETNLEMEGARREAPNMKDVEYRSFDFDSSNSSLDNYFQRLDSFGDNRSQINEEQEIQTLAHFGEIALYRIAKNVYAIKTPELMGQWLVHCLSTGDKTPMPLLVSQPLDLKRPLSTGALQALVEIGFEVDKIGPEDYVLRTFPGCLKNFPFRDYLQSFLNSVSSHDKNIVESLASVRLEEQATWGHYHKRALESMGIAALVNSDVAVEITKEKLEKIL